MFWSLISAVLLAECIMMGNVKVAVLIQSDNLNFPKKAAQDRKMTQSRRRLIKRS